MNLQGNYVLTENDNWGIFATVEINEQSPRNIIQAILEEANAQSLDVKVEVVEDIISMVDWGEQISMDVTLYDREEVWATWNATIVIRKVINYK